MLVWILSAIVTTVSEVVPAKCLVSDFELNFFISVLESVGNNTHGIYF